jgi:hypothetical protein
LLLVLLHSFVYSIMVLFLFNLAFCPALPTLTYADLSGSRFPRCNVEGGVSPLRKILNELRSGYAQKKLRVIP